MLPRRVYFRGGEEAGGGSPNWAAEQGVGAKFTAAEHRRAVSRARSTNSSHATAALFRFTRARDSAIRRDPLITIPIMILILFDVSLP